MIELTIFYDGMCPICRREMRLLQLHDGSERLAPVDINAVDFAANYPHIDPFAATELMHAETSQGELLVGLDAVLRARQLVGQQRWLSMLSWPLIKPVADVMYKCLAKHRYRVSALLTGKARCQSCSLK